MVKRIAMFNHKGGVSKTTTTFNLGWMLAQMDHRVILVDGDPQSNLTGLVLGYSGPSEFEEFYRKEPDRNFKSGLAPAFESRPSLIEPVECLTTPQEGLYLLPGNIALTEYEVTLSLAQALSSSIHTLQNLPGSISHLLMATAEHMDADFILVDMNPSLSSFNQNLLMTSDYFIVPTAPDFFSAMAIDSLAKVIPGWHNWSMQARALPVLRDAVYPFPEATPRFLGSIIQNYRPRDGRPSSGFQQWIDTINVKIADKLVHSLRDIDMTFPDDEYRSAGLDDYCLAMISDFNSLIAMSQKKQTPVFALTADQIGQSGTVLQTTQEAQNNFRILFEKVATEVITLTNRARSN